MRASAGIAGQHGSDTSALAGGVCTTLPVHVADAYWGARLLDDRFRFLTAQMMCAGCPVREACLVEAITQRSQPVGGVRAGVWMSTVWALRHEYRTSNVSAWKIARRELAHWVPPFRGAHGQVSMRQGKFPSPQLLDG
jgi:hypothetical protein